MERLSTLITQGSAKTGQLLESLNALEKHTSNLENSISELNLMLQPIMLSVEHEGPKTCKEDPTDVVDRAKMVYHIAGRIEILNFTICRIITNLEV